ncbi:hypothetical protein [Frankia sp. QA3]|uniref:hypothetical protein n=1 Tax=Frankia sp. QA3 TaxID=710111 RepID=UPI001E5D1494|nr:hypothetical protein [Frankia sp. QA3]
MRSSIIQSIGPRRSGRLPVGPIAGREGLTAALGPEHPSGRALPDSAKIRDARDPVETPRLDGRLEKIYNESLPTPAGRAFFETDDARLRQSALTPRPKTGFYTADLHGSPSAFRVGGETLGAEDLADLIRVDETGQNRSVRLLSCSTGAGRKPVAQGLANELGVRVEAPTGPLWVNHRGVPMIDSAETRSWYGAKATEEGSWRSFDPDRTRT